jgi:hypothetical protein
LLKIFRTNQVLLHALVGGYLIILWLPTFITQPAITKVYDGYLFNTILSWLPEWGTFHLIVAMALIWIQGFFLSKMNLDYRMGPSMTLFPGLMLTLFYASAPDFLSLNPFILANTLIIFALGSAFQLYQNKKSALVTFNLGFLISLAALIYTPYIVFLIAGFYALSKMRGLDIREITQLMIGAMLPWFFLYFAYYWYGQSGSFMAWWGGIPGFPVLAGPSGWRVYINVFLFLVLIIFTITQSQKINLGEKIQVQKNISITYMFLLLSGLSIFIANALYFEHFLITAVPIGLILGLWMARLPEKWAESFHLMLFLAILVYQYFPLMYL